MRRIVALGLVLLFSLQATASAATLRQADLQPIISALQSSWLFAVVTGQSDHYARTHWFTPHGIQGPRPQITPNPAWRTSAKRMMAAAPGGRGNAVVILPERVGKPIQSSHQAARIKRAMITRQGQSSVPSTTGIQKYWTYSQHPLPGVGTALTNVANGNVMVHVNDVDVPERGIDFAFGRVYNSQSTHDVVNTDQSVQSNYGDGWTSTLDAHLGYDAAANVISVYDATGARFDYTWNAATSSWTPPAGMYATLTESSNHCGYIWQQTNGTELTFWKPVAACGTPQAYWGRLCTIAGRNLNNYIVSNYSWTDGAGNAGAEPTQILWSHSDGATMTLTFGVSGGHRELANIQRPDGGVITYGYTGTTLVSVIHPGNSANPYPAEEYQYYPGGHQLQIVFSPRDVASSGSDGAYVGFAYDSSNRILTIADYAQVNFTPNDGTSAGALQTPGPGVPSSGIAEWHWESFSNWGQGNTQLNDTSGHSAGWVYDALGRVTDTAHYTGSGTLSLYYGTTWDSNNEVTQTTDPRGNATNYGYVNGDLVSVQEPQVPTNFGLGQPLARFAYDSHHNLIAYCDAYYEWTTGAPTCAPVAGTAHYTYTPTASDPFGDLTESFSPCYQYSQDNCASNGSDTKYVYDGNGLLQSATGAPITNDGGRTPTKTFVYNTNGTLYSYNNGGGTWKFGYDAMNRRNSVTDPDGTSSNPLTSYTNYNPDGTVNDTETPAQYASSPKTGSTFQYDADGNLIQSTVVRQASVNVSPAPVTTQKFYDGEDRLVEVDQPQDKSADVYTNPWITRYIYDLSNTALSNNQNVGYRGASFRAYGNLYKTQELLPSGAASGPVSMSVSTPQSIANTTPVDLKATAFDALDRPVANYSEINQALITDNLTYDVPNSQFPSDTPTGLLSQECNSAMSIQCTSYKYDSLGNILNVNFNDVSTPNRTAMYDPDGRPATIGSTAYSTPVTIQYDADGRETSYAEAQGGGITSPATFTHQYYSDGTLQSVDVSSAGLNQTGLFSYSYQTDGHVHSETITDIAQANVGSTSVQYQYTAAGRPTKRTETGPGALPGATTTYGYDANQQLSSITMPTCSWCGAYSISNLTYDPQQQLLTQSAPAVQNFAYSTRGEFHQDQWSFMANGVPVQSANPGTGTSINTWDAVTGAAVSSSFSSLSGEGNDTNLQVTYDAIGRMMSSVYVNSNGNQDSLSRSFDAENYTIGSNDNITTGGLTRTSYAWGPAGHPVLIGSASSTTAMPSSVSQYDTLHWDGDQLVFVTNSSGAVDDIKWGTQADITPLDPTFKGLTFWDRGPGGAIAFCHNNSGITGGSGPSYYTKDGAPCATGAVPGSDGVHTISIPSSFVWSSAEVNTNGSAKFSTYQHVTGIGQGALLGMNRIDGFTDGLNTFQGVRTYDSASSQWTTPDDYAGDVDNPASQKSYLWNGANPVANVDTSGHIAVACRNWCFINRFPMEGLDLSEILGLLGVPWDGDQVTTPKTDNTKKRPANACVVAALGKATPGALIDAIGLIPEGGRLSALLGKAQGFRGFMKVQQGASMAKGLKFGAGALATVNGAQDTSQLGQASTALGVMGAFSILARSAPGLGSLIAGGSVSVDVAKFNEDMNACPK